MSKATKTWLIIGVSLIIVGCMAFGGVMMAINFDFSKLSTTKFQNNTYDFNEDFTNISILTDTADVKLLPSSSDNSSVVCYETEAYKHSVAIVGNTLTIKLIDNRKWYQHIEINFGSPKITLYLSKEKYDNLILTGSTGDVEIPDTFKFKTVDISLSTGDVKLLASADEQIKITTSTGHIDLKDISAGSLLTSVSTGDVTASNINVKGELKSTVSTGDLKFANINCGSFVSSGNTGDVKLKNFIATDRLSIKRTTGYVKLDLCDAGEISIKTDTGSVKGTLLSNKVFLTESSTGSINVPKTTTGGRCEIETDTGDIKINIKNKGL